MFGQEFGQESIGGSNGGLNVRKAMFGVFPRHTLLMRFFTWWVSKHTVQNQQWRKQSEPAARATMRFTSRKRKYVKQHNERLVSVNTCWRQLRLSASDVWPLQYTMNHLRFMISSLVVSVDPALLMFSYPHWTRGPPSHINNKSCSVSLEVTCIAPFTLPLRIVTL